MEMDHIRHVIVVGFIIRNASSMNIYSGFQNLTLRLVLKIGLLISPEHNILYVPAKLEGHKLPLRCFKNLLKENVLGLVW